MAIIVDSSLWIDHLTSEPVAAIDRAIAEGTLFLPPLVIAELLSGELTLPLRDLVSNLLQDYPLVDTPLQHWMDVGALRRVLRSRGVNATLPDAHVAQCALDLNALLLTRDEIFPQIAKHTSLRVLR